MLELLFGILMLVVFGKLFVFGMKATWGITRGPAQNFKGNIAILIKSS